MSNLLLLQILHTKLIFGPGSHLRFIKREIALDLFLLNYSVIEETVLDWNLSFNSHITLFLKDC